MTQQEFFNRYTYSVKADRIGGGGFGTVYRATDKLLHRKVAVKVSEVKIVGDKEFSLKAEFDAVGKLPPHQNIAHYEELYSFESPQGVFDYAVMQYYEDGNLKNLIDKGCLTFEQKEKIAVGILDGIAFLHGNKVVHRDLKPANILICREGGDYVPLITDFGLSKGVEEMSKSGFTNSVAGGSPGYISPEQIKGGIMQLNTDLWSYGVIVYELFSGRRLFQSASQSGGTTEVNEMILHKDISAEIAALPGKWRMVAERCLVRDNRLRAKNAEELCGIINGEAGGTEPCVDDEVTVVEEPEPTPTPKPAPKPTPQPKPERNLTWLWVILSLIVVGGIVIYIIDSKKEDGIQTFIVGGVSFNMVKIDGGEFKMGNDAYDKDADEDEYPAVSKHLGDFFIGETEVTQKLWKAVMGKNPSTDIGDNKPVNNVNWEDCQIFIQKLNQKTGRNFRLPYESEWEYAAKHNPKTQKSEKYSGGNYVDDCAWYKGNSENKIHTVMGKNKNAHGLYDMSGNVIEWCQDVYLDYSDVTPILNSNERVLRGGYYGSDAVGVRSTCRGSCNAEERSSKLACFGLRLCL